MIMQYQGLDKKLHDAVSPLFKSTIITADGAVASFLQEIAKTPEFFGIIKDVSTGFDYGTELRKLTYGSEKDELNVPQNKRTLVALVTRLLYDFNKGEKSIIDFITTTFKASSYQESYRKFIDKLIAPYADAFAYLAEGGAAPKEELEIAEKLPETPFSDTVADETKYYLGLLKNKLDGVAKLPETGRADILTSIAGMEYVVDAKNPLLIKLAFIAIKNTFALYRLEAIEIAGMERLFKTFGIL